MAVAVVAVAVVAVAFVAAATGAAALHLNILLREGTGPSAPGVAVMAVGRGRRVRAAAVAALGGEAEVRPALAEATHPVQLCDGATP